MYTKNSALLKCGEWLVYAERVTNRTMSHTHVVHCNRRRPLRSKHYTLSTRMSGGLTMENGLLAKRAKVVLRQVLCVYISALSRPQTCY